MQLSSVGLDMIDKDYAVRSDHISDDDFSHELRYVANSDLPPIEKLELLTLKLDVTCREDTHRPIRCALNPFIPKRWRSAACRWGLCG